MRTCSLQSGSNGNAIYVECGDVALLFDAGISARRATQRLATHQRSPRAVTGLLVTHAHGDHMRHAAIWQRVFKLPIYATPQTARHIEPILAFKGDVRHFEAGATLSFGTVNVHSIPTPHDADGSVMFIIEHGGKRLGLFTDIGHPCPAIIDAMPTLDALYIESNYDPQMLEFGPYPTFLKQRIRGGDGHLSNRQAAELLTRCDARRLKWAALAHLSERNNSPDVALRTHRDVLGDSFPLWVAGRHAASALMTV